MRASRGTKGKIIGAKRSTELARFLFNWLVVRLVVR
jgi:hypothetical protein